MNLQLQNQVFTESFEKGFTKCALNPRVIERIAFDPRRTEELAAMGKSVWNKSFKNSNPLAGILSTSLAGYGQLRDTHATRSQFLHEISGIRKLMSAYPESHPTRVDLSTKLADKIRAYHSDFKQRMAEIGAVSEPRRRFLNTTLPTTAGVAGGLGVGAVGGNYIGQQQRENSAANATFGDRLKYLLNPGLVPRQSAPQPSAEMPSATDTGGV